MKFILVLIVSVAPYIIYAQNEDKPLKGSSDATLHAVKDNIISPRIFLGQISSNPAVSNFGVDLTDQSINLKGVFFESKRGGFVASANVKGKNENSTLGIFGSGNLNPKISGDVNLTYNFADKVKYSILNKKLKDSTPTYNEILLQPENYSANRQRFKFLTFGLLGDGAKYYIIDSTALFDDMLEKRKYTGWQMYGQFNILDYHKEKNNTLVHSFRASYGQTNNVSDLNEYSISNSTSFTNGSNARKIERKITGYFDDYFVQHQGILSYEFNFYNMDTTALKVGLIAGADFVYNSKQKNFMRFNAGLNFPLVYSKAGKDKRRLYIGAIISTTDSFNWREKDDFSFKNTLSASIRLVSPIKFNFKNK